MDAKQFERVELQRGCGYWNVCDDHSCPCSPSSLVSQGLNIKVYESMRKQQEKEREELERTEW